MRFPLLSTATIVMGLSFLSPVQAQDYNTLLDVPKGSTLVNLSASEHVEIEQDLLTATLSYQAENKDAKTVQNDVNRKMKKALEAAQKVASVKASTQQYYVYEYNRNNKKNGRRDMVWRAQQGIVLKGKTADELLKLTGKLQEMGLAINNLSYSVSPELLEKTRNGLLEDALKKLREKAERTAKALGKATTEFLQINVDMDGNYNQPMERAMMMRSSMKMEAMADPVAAPGESEVTLSVKANALLSE